MRAGRGAPRGQSGRADGPRLQRHGLSVPSPLSAYTTCEAPHQTRIRDARSSISDRTHDVLGAHQGGFKAEASPTNPPIDRQRAAGIVSCPVLVAGEVVVGALDAYRASTRVHLRLVFCLAIAAVLFPPGYADARAHSLTQAQRTSDRIIRQAQNALDHAGVVLMQIREAKRVSTAALSDTRSEIEQAQIASRRHRSLLPRGAYRKISRGLALAAPWFSGGASSPRSTTSAGTTLQAGTEVGDCDSLAQNPVALGGDAGDKIEAVVGKLGDASASLDPYVDAADPEELGAVVTGGPVGTVVIAEADTQGDENGAPSIAPDTCQTVGGAPSAAAATPQAPVAVAVPCPNGQPPVNGRCCVDHDCLTSYEWPPNPKQLVLPKPVVLSCSLEAPTVPIETATFKYGVSAESHAASYCDYDPNDLQERVVRVCLQSRNQTVFGAPWRTRKCTQHPHFGYTRRTDYVSWYCRKTRDWRARATMTVFINGQRKGRVTIYSVNYDTLNCP